MSPPRVSVIVPVFNGERTLRRALDSVLAQADVAALELVVIDDGSTDRSAEIATSYAEVRLLRQDNAGQAAARNRGIRESLGELVSFNDADDAWSPGRLAAQIAALDREPALEFVICNFENVADEGFAVPAWALREAQAEGMPGFIFQAMLARRRAFETIGMLDESMRWAEDTDWFLRAHDAGAKAARIDQVGVYRYVHDRNLTGQVAQSHKGLVRALHASVVRRRLRGVGSAAELAGEHEK